MPTENEFKYVLDDQDGSLEAGLAAAVDIRAVEIFQGYLNDDTRIRRIVDKASGDVTHMFSFKRKAGGRTVEIETEISAEDFVSLWATRERSLKKRRYSFEEEGVHWDVDFIVRGGRTPYFVIAEAEVDEAVEICPEISPRLEDALLFVAGKQRGYSSRRLCDEKFARDLLAACRRVKTERDGREATLLPLKMAS